MHQHAELLARQTGLPARSVAGCLRLLDEGNTIPFIARYRKEMTGSLDEVQLRHVEDAFVKLKELLARKETILKTIAELGKLTDELRRRIEGCFDRQELEDLYLPYKPQRKTRASVARAAGLEPLAEMMLGRRPAPGNRIQAARAFLNPDAGIKDVDDALAGARDIVAEEITSLPAVRAELRDFVWRTADIASSRKRGAGEEAETYRDWFDHRERLNRVPSHRFLALQRGERDDALSVRLEIDDERAASLVRRDLLRRVPEAFRRDVLEAVEDGWKRLLSPALQRELLARVKESADVAAVEVFENNLRALLMTPPARNHRVLGVDPGFRNGCKMAVVDATGKVLATATVYPHPPQDQAREARARIAELCRKHRVDVIGVGDGTAHRETMALLEASPFDPPVTVEPVREAGASVYSASELAGKELGNMDVTLRGAVSIARRYQDPLAELVKIEPRSLGVGQYQHDVDQKLLGRGLDAVVEECVNRVGVELNTASPSLLAHVAGIGPKLAGAIVDHRDRNGRFRTRQELLKVPGLGPAKFTQCAGFLRIPDGTEPLDATAIHPERYGTIKVAARKAGISLADVLGKADLASRIASLVQADDAGDETRADIRAELERPGRDPRGEREAFRFAEGIHSIDDLQPGMVLPGRVTSVTDFGAFVDIGIHRNGLVHISQMSERRIKTPFEVCQPQQVVKVKVLDVDRKRNRISLTLRV